MLKPDLLRSLTALRESLVSPDIKIVLGTCSSLALTSINERMQDHKNIYDLLCRAIAEQPALTLKDGRVIKDGFNADLDELRS